MFRRFLLRWLINFLGIWIAGNLLSGVSYGDDIGVVVVAALLFSVVNALIRPLVIVLSLPAIVLTLGLFMLVVNGFMLYLTSLIYSPFKVTSLWQAIIAVIIVWAVNYVLTELMEGARNESAV